MTRADFYVLPEADLLARQTFACRLSQKALRSGVSVYIAVDDSDQAEQVSNLLWSFQPESFLPHSLTAQSADEAPIRVGHGEQCGDYHGLLINLGQGVPPYFSQFERLAEIVCQTEPVLASTRENYNFYRHRGYPLTTHDLRKPQKSN